MADNHKKDLSIYQMVLNRLPFLSDTDKNKQRISEFTLEVMYEIEPCLKIDRNLPKGGESRIGDEAYYSTGQRSLIADIVCVYILMLQMLANTGGVAEGSDIKAANNKFLSKAKAGSAEAEWEQFDLSKGSTLAISGNDLLNAYKASAIRKANLMGCLIDFCNNCSIAVELLLGYTMPTPIVVSDCGCCGNRGKTIPERG